MMRAGMNNQHFSGEPAVVIDKSLGTKQLCPACHAKFYDLNRSPAKCPKCGEEFVPKPILPSKQDQVEAAAKAEEAAAAEAAPAVEDVIEDVAVEVDEAADVPEVALEDADEVSVAPDDDTLLEDDDTPVEDIIPTKPVDGDDEE